MHCGVNCRGDFDLYLRPIDTMIHVNGKPGFPEVNYPLTVAVDTVTAHLKLNYYTDQTKDILHHLALQENNEIYPQ